MYLRTFVHPFVPNEMVCYTTLILRTSEVAGFDAVRASNDGPSKNQAVVVQDCFNLCEVLFFI